MILLLRQNTEDDRWSLLVLVYHCFDRVVIHDYLSGWSRPEQVVYFFREVVGVPPITKEVLSQRTNDYQNWSRPTLATSQFPSSGRRRESAKRMTWKLRGGGWRRPIATAFISFLKSMEQGSTFRSRAPKYPTPDPGYHILARPRTRFTPYYLYLRDEVLGPMVVGVASFFPFHITYWL